MLVQVIDRNESTPTLSEAKITILVLIRDAVRGIVSQLVQDTAPKSIYLRAERMMFVLVFLWFGCNHG